VLLCSLIGFAGCSKKKSEPRIFGKASDPPVSLQCAWKPGNRYHLRLEMAVLTEAPGADPQIDDTGLHQVNFAQEYFITATNLANGDKTGLDMEIVSLAMERSRAGQVALSFDSDQGGESADDIGYVPVLKNLVGGHLHFLLSPEGKVIRTVGLNEWLAAALGEAPGVAGPPKKRVSRSNTTNVINVTNVAPASAGGFLTNVLANLPQMATQITARILKGPPGAMGPQTRIRGTVANTLRNFFSPDLFRQMLEFEFLPASPVRVKQEWKTKGDQPVSGRGRFNCEAVGQFVGWQQHGNTNCARIDLHGKLTAGGNPAPPAGKPASANPPPANPAVTQKSGTIQGTFWIDPGLSLPATTMLDKEVTLAAPTNARNASTNSPPKKIQPKSVRQTLTITLLDVTPFPASAVEGTASSQ
jgi:hypothetical protein